MCSVAVFGEKNKCANKPSDKPTPLPQPNFSNTISYFLHLGKLPANPLSETYPSWDILPEGYSIVRFLLRRTRRLHWGINLSTMPSIFASLRPAGDDDGRGSTQVAGLSFFWQSSHIQAFFGLISWRDSCGVLKLLLFIKSQTRKTFQNVTSFLQLSDS